MPVLSNKAIQLDKRRRFAQSLLQTRLFYLAGAWPDVSNNNRSILNHVAATYARTMAAKAGDLDDSGLTDIEWFAMASLPTPTHIIIAERLRLYARVRVHGAHSSHVWIDATQQIPLSWMTLVKQTFEWMSTNNKSLSELPTKVDTRHKLRAWDDYIDKITHLWRFRVRGTLNRAIRHSKQHALMGARANGLSGRRTHSVFHMGSNIDQMSYLT